MKISLVFPRTKYVSGDPPLGLSYLAAYARQAMADADITILDSTFTRSLESITERLQKIRPDIVGIFVDTLMYNDALIVASAAREMGSFILTGGPHATVCPESLVGCSDIVVKGEGEEALVEILRIFRERGRSGLEEMRERTKILEGPKQQIFKLDNIPFPALDLLDMANYREAWHYLDSVDVGLTGTNVISSRGCPYRCSYCQPTLDLLFGPKLRRRSPENVVEEIAHLKDAFSIGGIFFNDDTFTVDKRWIMEFCDLMKKKNIDIFWGCNSRINTADDEDLLEAMYKVGLRNIHFGIESGSQRVLDEIYKKGMRLSDVENVLKLTKKMKIHALGFFMIGSPGETPAEIDATIRLAHRLPLDEATFSITTPLLGTFLCDMVKSSPQYIVSDDFGDFDYYRTTPIKAGGLPISRLKYLQKKALCIFYLHPRRIGYILRHLLTLKGIKKLLTKIKRFI